MSSPRRFKTACYAYPCSVENGVTSEDFLSYIKTNYVVNDVVKSWGTKFPQLEVDDDYFDMQWVDVEEQIKNTDWFKRFSKGETYFSDGTMMQRDFTSLKKSLIVNISHYFKMITELENTQLQMLSSFLQGKAEKDEIKIVCLIGHGLTEKQARVLNENPPKYDGDSCTDYSEMKSPHWKWPLINCDGKEGLGEGYTANSVCKNAKKGDIVVFGSGFLTPEWIVERLRKRERNPYNGSIPYTLVLLVDSCFSGVWIERIRETLNKKKLSHTRVVVQTACGADEESYGQYFIPHWLDLQNGLKYETNVILEDTEPVQTPTYFDSKIGSNGTVGGLRFFRGNVPLQYSILCSRSRSNEKLRQFLSDFIDGAVTHTIHCYQLSVHKAAKTPQAFFVVEIKGEMQNLHIHFEKFPATDITAIHSFKTEKYSKCDYPYGEIKDTRQEWNVNSVARKGMASQIVQLCKDRVSEEFWNSNNKWRKHWFFPFRCCPYYSRSVVFDSLDPTNNIMLLLICWLISAAVE